MHIWLIQTGDPLPIDGEVPRLMRTGMMAQRLVDRGHEVTWWCTTFDHWTKSHRYPQDTTVELGPRYRLRMLHSPGYTRNVSIARVMDHIVLGKHFAREIRRVPVPDVILSSLPTIEMAEAASDFGKEFDIPVITDVRDLWPDAFLNFIPSPLKPLGRLVLHRMYRQVERAMKESTAIVSISDGYLEWALRAAGRERRATDALFPLSYERPQPTVKELQGAERRLRGHGVNPDKVICWFIGTFGRTYDLRTVIQAARIFHDGNDSRAQFVLSGHGGALPECRELAEGLPNVVFTGWLNSTEIEWMMRSADIGLAAYVQNAPQGLPNKLFEYLAGGLAVLSSLGSEAAALLSDTGCGLSYEPEKPQSLVAALTRLLDDSGLRRNMKSAARKTFDERFSADRVYGPFMDYLELFGAQSHSEPNESDVFTPTTANIDEIRNR